MTFADDLMDEQEQEEQSPYPEAFGITFTPPVLGGVLGVLGVAGAAAIGWYLIKPQWDNLQAIKTQVDEKELQRVQLEQSQQQITQLQADLQKAQADQRQVLSLFAGEASFDTFLYTLSQRFNNRGQLLKYTPPTEEATVVTDSSWGSDVNELLKTQTLSLQMEASFEQTMGILRDIERLQTLAALKNIKSEVTTTEQRLVNAQGTVSTAGEALLTTSFDLELLFPVSAEELMESSAAAQAEAEAAADDPNAEQPAQ